MAWLANAPGRDRSSQRGARVTPVSDFVAPVVTPTEIPLADFGDSDLGIPGGVEGGIPGGVVGGIVGGLPQTPPPPPISDEPVRVGADKEEARPLRRVDPVYPDLAAQARVKGIVIVEVLVDAQGIPSQTRVLRSVPLLDAAAIEAVKQWRWKPYLSGGRAVPFLVTVTVNFRLKTS